MDVETFAGVWFVAGRKDRELGNTIPAMTVEDFYRDYPPDRAIVAFESYYKGWEGEQL
jgi:hypothetical protein